MKLEGIFAAAVTAVTQDGAVDRRRTQQHAERLLGQGCHGVALFGTTGEAASFTIAERKAMLGHLVQAGVAAERVLPGIGLCARDDTLELALHALDLGCRHLLMLPPFFYKGVSDAGVIAAYSEVLERLPPEAGIILYHFPKVSAVPITQPVVRALRERFGSMVVGIKDSTADLEHTLGMIEAFPDLSVFPGADHHLLTTLQAGGAGSISAAANLNGAGSRRVFDLFRAGDGVQAEEAQLSVTAVRRAVEGGPLIPIIKALLAHRLEDPAWRRVRPPLCELEDDSALEPGLAALAKIGRNV
ncbi:dihydrodipicolinate synthase family protein [Geminicoccus roseus]|uniref:dihydrodipicolinate synthase family protein n=1 Tax=Geminicoccus roseus TaxID=404900 RepID=UPI0004221661|nr:dihydrodipicolinate synthase family protein [Geminicoccus roseus]